MWFRIVNYCTDVLHFYYVRWRVQTSIRHTLMKFTVILTDIDSWNMFESISSFINRVQFCVFCNLPYLYLKNTLCLENNCVRLKILHTISCRRWLKNIHNRSSTTLNKIVHSKTHRCQTVIAKTFWLGNISGKTSASKRRCQNG